MTEQVVEFIELINHPDYEILNIYPFTIRKKSNHYVVSESVDGNGYVQCKLNRKTYMKHRLIAEQFIPNPEDFPYIDHINRDRTDYHLSNLRWCSVSDNNRNKSSHLGIEYVFVDNIDGDSIVVNEYNNHQLENYYYDEQTDKFYFWNGIQYRELHINEKKNGSKFVCMTSTENKKIHVFYTKFKELYGLI